jgi:hypothetical protein
MARQRKRNRCNGGWLNVDGTTGMVNARPTRHIVLKDGTAKAAGRTHAPLVENMSRNFKLLQ